MTETRYQVFISSTFEDLREERRLVQQGILRFGGFPAGMELFAASNASQWELIKKVIDLSDYYVLIVAGRYGSIDEESGLSYTEKEFDYAVEQNKPILAFVHSKPEEIASGLTDENDKLREQLKEFRSKVTSGRTVSFYNSNAELESAVISALFIESKENPMNGWVRGDQAMTLESQKEMADLKAKLAELELSQSESESTFSEDISSLASGSDLTSLHVVLEYGYHHSRKSQTALVSISWDGIFSTIGPALLNEETEAKLQDILSRKLAVLALEQELFNTETSSDPINPDARCHADEWSTVVIQLKALGLIGVGTKRRSTTDKGKYLGLTQRGERHLMFLRAIRNDDPNQSADRTEAQPEPASPPAEPSPKPEA